MADLLEQLKKHLKLIDEQRDYIEHYLSNSLDGKQKMLNSSNDKFIKSLHSLILCTIHLLNEYEPKHLTLLLSKHGHHIGNIGDAKTTKGKRKEMLIAEELSGGGLFDSISKAFGKVVNKVKEVSSDVGNVFTNKYSRSAEKALVKYGGYAVTAVQFCRTPVSVKSILNVLSFGQFSKNVSSNYDDVYHLYAIIQLKDINGMARYALTEKTPNIIWEDRAGFDAPKQGLETVVYIPNKPVNFGDMYNMALTKSTHYYDPRSKNCQEYCLQLCDALRVLADGPDDNNVKNFIYQDPQILFKNLETLGKVSKGITDTGHFFNRLIGKNIKVI